MVSKKNKTQNDGFMITLAIGLILLTTIVIVVSNGNIGAALAPSILVIATLAIVTLPLRITVSFFLGIVLLFHNVTIQPMEGLWQGPLTLLGPLIYNNLYMTTGIGALRFNTIEVGLASFLLVMVARTVTNNNIDGHQTMPAARPMKTAVLVAFSATLIAILWGIARGGDFKQMLWQARMFGWAPAIIIISMRAFKTEHDFRLLGLLVVGLAVVRILEGVYFYFAIVRPQGLLVEYVMTHDDTVLFVAAMVVLMSWILEHLVLSSIFWGSSVAVFVLYGIIINDRRIAYVSLALCLPVIYYSLQHPVKRWLTRTILFTLPVWILYIVIGMYSTSAIFAPVRNLVSVTDEEDNSNRSRDVENLNLIMTAYQSPILGSGFGHPYVQFIPAVDISSSMENFLFLPHNSVLWLASIGGLWGFYCMWFYLPVGAFLGFRSRRCANNSTHRITAVTSISTVIVYMVQAYGDMGAISWMATIIMGVGMGVAANLVMRTGGLEVR